MRQSTYDNVMKVDEMVKNNPTIGISRAIEIVGIANPTYYIAKRKIAAGAMPTTTGVKAKSTNPEAVRKLKAYHAKKNKKPEMVTLPVAEDRPMTRAEIVMCLIGTPDMVLKTAERFVK